MFPNYNWYSFLRIKKFEAHSFRNQPLDTRIIRISLRGCRINRLNNRETSLYQLQLISRNFAEFRTLRRLNVRLDIIVSLSVVNCYSSNLLKSCGDPLYEHQLLHPRRGKSNERFLRRRNDTTSYV